MAQKGPQGRSFCPCTVWGALAVQAHECVCRPGSSPSLEGFLRRLHHTGVINGPLNLQPLSLCRGRGLWLKIPSLSQLGPSGDQPPCRSHRETTERHCIRIKDTPITQRIPEGLGALCPTLRAKGASGPFYCLENYKAFKSSGQELGLTSRIHISS